MNVIDESTSSNMKVTMDWPPKSRSDDASTAATFAVMI